MITPSVPLWATATVAVLVGALVGSFLNVVAYRVPQHLSIVAPGSFCPACRRSLAWWENVPVIGWLALRGRCRTCKAPIAPRYPLVEAGNAAMWAAIAVAAGGRQVTIPLCILASTIVAVWLIELDGHRAPRAVAAIGTALAAVAAAIARVAVGHGPLVGVLIGAAGGTVAYAVVVAADRPASTWAIHGRSALVPGGAFLGGLPLVAALAGGATIVVATSGAALAAAVGSRAAAAPADRSDGDDSPGGPPGADATRPDATGCGGTCASCGSAGACATADPGRPALRLPDLGVLAGAAILGSCVAVAVAAALPPSSWP